MHFCYYLFWSFCDEKFKQIGCAFNFITGIIKMCKCKLQLATLVFLMVLFFDCIAIFFNEWKYCSGNYFNNYLKFYSIVRNEQKELKIAPVHKIDIPFKTATFGMGCFWGAEALYGGTLGILRTTVGYAGGIQDKPTYRNIGDHTEVLEIDYDPKIINYKELLDLFWDNHEYGLSEVIKRQYMSLILYHDEEQKQIAEKSRGEEISRRAPEKIVTEIIPKTTFFPAEDYHQKYRLQEHSDLSETLNLNSTMLKTSYVATKLNGYLAGVGGIEQFKSEVDKMGLTQTQKEYCYYYIEKNEGHGLYC